MQGVSLPAAAAVAMLLAACGQAASARQVRKATDGGTFLVTGGSDSSAAYRAAIASIEQHCRGLYEVVEVSQVETGRTQSMGVAYSFGPVSFGTSGSSPVYGTSVTYVCREPSSTELNDALLALATADIVGRKCAGDGDCGPLFCVRETPAAARGTCRAGERAGSR